MSLKIKPQTKRVLVVDDVPDNLLLAQFFLETQGYTVSTVESGKAALAYVATEIANPNIIILDLMMPEMNGYEVIDDLRHHQNLPNIPILLMTANQDVSYEDARNAGANSLVYKPLDLTQFLEKVESFAV